MISPFFDYFCKMDLEELKETISKEGNEFNFEYGHITCFGKRSDLLNWNGYIEIPHFHPCFKDKDFEPTHFLVHGGVTFSEKNTQGYVVGFDCAHANDLVPFYMTILPDMPEKGEYRTKEYVMSQCRSVVDQLDEQYPSYSEVINDVYLKIND